MIVKKKIKDLTPEEANRICDCILECGDDCPLCYTTKCPNYQVGDEEKIVEIPNDEIKYCGPLNEV